MFLENVRAKRRRDLKIVLAYDGHRSLLGATGLEVLNSAVALVYRLSTHTHGRTQPLDIGLYGLFKNELTSEIKYAVQLCDTVKFEQFDFFHMICHAYAKSFNAPNIVTAFYKAGLWLVNSRVPLGTACPNRADD